MREYTLSADEMESVVDWINTARRFDQPFHVRCDDQGFRMKVGDQTWSLPLGTESQPSGESRGWIEFDGGAVIELPDEGPHDPRD